MSDFMNKPIETDGQAYLEFDYKQMKPFVHCPFCGKKQFAVGDDTKIAHLNYKCRGSNCKRKFEINV